MKPKPLPAKARAPLVRAKLAETYPDAGIALTFSNPLELAVATILSAQCTDKRVNLVTPALFARYPTCQDYADADLAEIERFIQSAGFFRNKARFIRDLARVLLAEHNGQVPADLATLVTLPGIGRKTANVVLGDAFGIPGITVDTHVGRLSRRLGFSKHLDPVKVEFDLMKLIPKPEWTPFSHRLILHGRAVCDARKPRCGDCVLLPHCPQKGVLTPAAKPRKSAALTPLRVRQPESPP